MTEAINQPDCVTASSLIRVVFRIARDHVWSWEAKLGSPVHTLRTWMKDKGWSEHGAWRWMRDGFGAYVWCCFVSAERHELWDLQDAVKRDWDRIRRYMQNPACRSIGLGAVVWVAWVALEVIVAIDVAVWVRGRTWRRVVR